MSSATVRRAVADWFASPAVQGLQRVWAAQPWYGSDREYMASVNGGWGAVGYVHLTEQSETRIALGGATGGTKEVTYRVGLVVLFKWNIPQGAPVAGTDESAYVTQLDQLLDDVVARLRSDRTLGGAVWQAGENPNDVKITRDLPKRMGNTAILAWQVVEFDVVEMVAA